MPEALAQIGLTGVALILAGVCIVLAFVVSAMQTRNLPKPKFKNTGLDSSVANALWDHMTPKDTGELLEIWLGNAPPQGPSLDADGQVLDLFQAVQPGQQYDQLFVRVLSLLLAERLGLDTVSLDATKQELSGLSTDRFLFIWGGGRPPRAFGERLQHHRGDSELSDEHSAQQRSLALARDAHCGAPVSRLVSLLEMPLAGLRWSLASWNSVRCDPNTGLRQMRTKMASGPRRYDNNERTSPHSATALRLPRM